MPLPQEIIRPFSPRARRKWIVSCDYPPRPCSHTERCTRERCSPLNVSTRGTGVVNLQCIATEERNSYQVFDVCYVHLIARVCVRLCVCVCILFSSWQIYSPIWPLNHVWSGSIDAGLIEYKWGVSSLALERSRCLQNCKNCIVRWWTKWLLLMLSSFKSRAAWEISNDCDAIREVKQSKNGLVFCFTFFFSLSIFFF